MELAALHEIAGVVLAGYAVESASEHGFRLGVKTSLFCREDIVPAVQQAAHGAIIDRIRETLEESARPQRFDA